MMNLVAVIFDDTNTATLVQTKDYLAVRELTSQIKNIADNLVANDLTESANPLLLVCAKCTKDSGKILQSLEVLIQYSSQIKTVEKKNFFMKVNEGFKENMPTGLSDTKYAEWLLSRLCAERVS